MAPVNLSLSSFYGFIVDCICLIKQNHAFNRLLHNVSGYTQLLPISPFFRFFSARSPVRRGKKNKERADLKP